MSRRLAGFTLATAPDGQGVVLDPSEPLPEWAEAAITNPAAWTDEPVADEPVKPARTRAAKS